MDKFGRKQLLSLSFSGMGASMLTMAAGFGLAGLAAFKGKIALIGALFSAPSSPPPATSLS